MKLDWKPSFCAQTNSRFEFVWMLATIQFFVQKIPIQSIQIPIQNSIGRSNNNIIVFIISHITIQQNNIFNDPSYLKLEL